jgi:import inner membrane translocase subunit TIM23
VLYLSSCGKRQLTDRIHATLSDIALMYNAVNSTIDAVRGEHDFAGGMAAAAISGAIFKSTGEFGCITIEKHTSLLMYQSVWLANFSGSPSIAGVKPALAGATIMMGASAAWTAAKKTLL